MKLKMSLLELCWFGPFLTSVATCLVPTSPESQLLYQPLLITSLLHPAVKLASACLKRCVCSHFVHQPILGCKKLLETIPAVRIESILRAEGPQVPPLPVQAVTYVHQKMITAERSSQQSLVILHICHFYRKSGYYHLFKNKSGTTKQDLCLTVMFHLFRKTHALCFPFQAAHGWVAGTFCSLHVSPSFSSDNISIHQLLCVAVYSQHGKKQPMLRVSQPPLATQAEQCHLSARTQVKKPGSRRKRTTATATRIPQGVTARFGVASSQ